MKKFRENRKAVSPVISTIIIVAVAIAISIAVAFWLGGITSIFTRFEKLEIPTAYAKADTGGWTVTLEVKNTGTTDVTITDILINGIPLTNNELSSLNVTGIDDTDASNGISLPTGKACTIEIPNTVITSSKYSAGQSITITLHTAGGQDYPKTVVLP